MSERVNAWVRSVGAVEMGGTKLCSVRTEARTNVHTYARMIHACMHAYVPGVLCDAVSAGDVLVLHAVVRNEPRCDHLHADAMCVRVCVGINYTQQYIMNCKGKGKGSEKTNTFFSVQRPSPL